MVAFACAILTRVCANDASRGFADFRIHDTAHNIREWMIQERSRKTPGARYGEKSLMKCPSVVSKTKL
jgi:hypothetical protein